MTFAPPLISSYLWEFSRVARLYVEAAAAVPPRYIAVSGVSEETLPPSSEGEDSNDVRSSSEKMSGEGYRP